MAMTHHIVARTHPCKLVTAACVIGLGAIVSRSLRTITSKGQA
jgi:hypothetical protein